MMHATRPTQQTLSETSTAQSKQKRRIIQSEMAGKRHLHEKVNFPRISLGTIPWNCIFYASEMLITYNSNQKHLQQTNIRTPYCFTVYIPLHISA